MSPILGITQVLEHSLVDVSAYKTSYLNHIGLQYDLSNLPIKETRKKWWYWLPNVGFGFGIPLISLNTNQLAIFDKQNEERKLKQLELHQTYFLKYNEGIQIIEMRYRLIQMKSNQIENEKFKFIIKENIFKIELTAYEKGGTIPIDRLKSQLTYENDKTYIILLENQLEEMILNLETFSFYKISQLPFRQDLQCILEVVDNP